MTSAVHPSHPSHHHSSSQSFPRPSGDVASFSSSFTSPYHPSAYANLYAHAQPQHDALTQAGSSFGNSFTDSNDRRPVSAHEPQIYTAVYSGVPVYEMELHGTAVMRRRADSWLNATQILKVAGIEKGRRTKILEKEILTGTHEKIQGGYGKYQGTWISYRRGREFCRQYGVEEALRPLLEYDINSDGTGNTAYNDTPTKEQAQAANRKKLFSSSMDSRMNGITPQSTFFQNISPTASTALAAMNKAARYESPMARPGSAPRRPQSNLHRQSSQQATHGPYHQASQQSMQSFTSDVGGETNDDAVLAALREGQGQINPSSQEPPKKKMRMSFGGHDPYIDPQFQEETPTEPAGSFSQHQLSQQHFPQDTEQGPVSLPPLPEPDEKDKASQEKRHALLDLFAEPSRTDFASHPAVQRLADQDLDFPLDTKANTALHWAAVLGKVSIVKALVEKGANLFRGNAAGETALMHAVHVNNSHVQNNFSEVLEYLGPLIELRDATGRTLLHHIAIATGVKGRQQSSKYYLESLLAFTVRQGGANSQGNSFTDKNGSQSFSAQQKSRPVNLARFMAEIVNVQDKTGNTALNLVSRIGVHTIINQLEEVGADFGIANHNGFRPQDFGIYPKSHYAQQASQGQSSQGLSNSQDSNGGVETKKTSSQIEQLQEEIYATTQTIISQTTSSYTTALQRHAEAHAHQSSQMRDLETQREELSTQLAALKARASGSTARRERLAHLKEVVGPLRQRHANKDAGESKKRSRQDLEISATTADNEPFERLRTLMTAHTTANNALSEKLTVMQKMAEKAETKEKELLYRKVVSLCTGVEEGRVESMLDELLGAVEGP